MIQQQFNDKNTKKYSGDKAIDGGLRGRRYFNDTTFSYQRYLLPQHVGNAFDMNYPRSKGTLHSSKSKSWSYFLAAAEGGVQDVSRRCDM